MRRLLPTPSVELDDAMLRAAYAPDRARSSVRLNFVSSLDGAVEVDGRSRGLSGEADQKVFGILRDHADAIMVGAGTLRQEEYRAVRLSEDRRAWRRGQGMPEYPTLVVVSAALDLDPDAPVFAEAPVRPIVLTHGCSPEQQRARLAAVADVLVCGESVVDLAVGLAELRRRGLGQVLCEGGPHLFGALLSAALVDELCLTFSALLAGPGAGRIVAGPTPPGPFPMCLALLIQAGEVLLTRYERASR
jgi:riboflavin biosynthesis pyrimidine reductase